MTLGEIAVTKPANEIATAQPEHPCSVQNESTDWKGILAEPRLDR